MTCPYCRHHDACACLQCGSCGGLTQSDEFADVHVCSSAWGELADAVSSYGNPGHAFMSSGQAGIYPDEPRCVHSVVLLAPATMARADTHDGMTMPTRVLR